MAVVWVERGGTAEPVGPDEGDLGDVAAAARAVLPPDVWGFVQGGSGAERTLRANRAAYDKVALRPRVLVDVGTISLRTSVLGADWGVPFGVAPMAYHRLAHPDGEIASASAAGELDTMFCASMFASRTFAEMAGATAGPRWLQVYYLRDRDTLADVLARAEQAGFGAVVLTVDTPHVATRPRDLGSSFTLPDEVRAVNLPEALMGTAHTATSRPLGDPAALGRNATTRRSPGPTCPGCGPGRACRCCSRACSPARTRGWRPSTGSTGSSCPTTAAGSWTPRCRAWPRCPRSSPRCRSRCRCCSTAASAAARTCSRRSPSAPGRC